MNKKEIKSGNEIDFTDIDSTILVPLHEKMNALRGMTRIVAEIIQDTDNQLWNSVHALHPETKGWSIIISYEEKKIKFNYKLTDGG